MIIKEEIRVRDFDFWGYAKETASKIKLDDWDEVEAMLDECFEDGLTSTELNDIFAYDDRFKEWLQDAKILPKEDE